MAMTANSPNYPNRAARKAAKRAQRTPRGSRPPALRPVPSPAQELAAQRARQEQYRQMWRRQVDALSVPDDPAYSVMRTPGLASTLGTARASSTPSAVAPAMLRYLERSDPSAPPPAPPTNQRMYDGLGVRARDPWLLAAARVALDRAAPALSLVFELTAWKRASEHDLARAFDEGDRAGWSRVSIHTRKWEAVTWIREWLARG